MPSSNLKLEPSSLTPRKRCVVSITTDRLAGGIANALVSYSEALTTKGHNHIIILPPSAAILPVLEKIKTVQLIKIPAGLIKFHLLTGGLFAQDIRSAMADADVFFCITAFFCES